MELVFLIPIAFFAAITFIVKWSLEYSRWKKQHDTGRFTSDSSLRMSELHALIHDAVVEATQPLAERVASLEQHAAREALPAAHDDMLDAADGYTAEAAPEAPQRLAVR